MVLPLFLGLATPCLAWAGDHPEQANNATRPAAFRCDPNREALLQALAAGHLTAAEGLLYNGLDPFAPGLVADPDGHHPCAVELASRLSPDFVELLIAHEKDPARIQQARNLALCGILQTWDPDRERSEQYRRLNEVLDRGARIDLRAGFRWAMLTCVLDKQRPEGDAPYQRMLGQDLPLDGASVRTLIRSISWLPAPRSLELLTALHKKAGSFEHLPELNEILSEARESRDEQVYLCLLPWVGKLDEGVRVDHLVASVADRRLASSKYWLGQGVNPYAKGQQRGESALDSAWEAHDDFFPQFMEALAASKLLLPEFLNQRLGEALTSGRLGDRKELAIKLDALAKVGITLKPFARHPLWSKPNKPAQPKDSFYFITYETAGILCELAERGLDLNRDFEGQPFLAGCFGMTLVSPITGDPKPRLPELIKQALRQGASPQQLVGGASLLHHAAYEGQIEIAQLFLEAGLPINSIEEPSKATPLMWAALGHRTKMVQWLLANHADPNLVTTDGWSVLGIVLQAVTQGKDVKDQQLAEILKQAGGLDIRPTSAG